MKFLPGDLEGEGEGGGVGGPVDLWGGASSFFLFVLMGVWSVPIGGHLAGHRTELWAHVRENFASVGL